METTTMRKTKWNVDPGHSEISFRVKHMMITHVSGSFEKYHVDIETEGNDFTTASITFTADLNTINTNNTDRDNHLKSPDFFDAARYPELKFVSTKLEKQGDDHYILYGDLTIKGLTRPVKFNVDFGGVGKDPWGNERAGFSLSGKINRTEFGLNWNTVLESGGILVGEEVKINGEVQLIKESTK